MVGSIVKSALREAIQGLPEDFSTKSQSVAPMLLKKGIKPEEIEYANIDIPKGKVTKKQLVEAEEGRKDKFYVKKERGDYSQYNIEPNNPTYQEKVLTFKQADGGDPGSRYTSEHFPGTPDYLMHTRVYDTDVAGTNARVLTEIQSDLHQTGRQQGYGADDTRTLLSQGDKDEVQRLSDEFDHYRDSDTEEELDELLDSLGYEGGGIQQWMDRASSPAVPKSPLEKNWLRKGIERELVDAKNEGRGQLMIPISGAVQDLHRAPGVQKWYETTVLSTAKKIAKQTNSDFSLVTKSAIELDGTPENIAKFKEAFSSGDITEANEWLGTLTHNEMVTPAQFADVHFPGLVKESLKGLEFADAVKRVENMYTQIDRSGAEDLVGAILENRTRDVEELLGSVGVTPADAVAYAVIKPRGEVNTTLYSTPVAGAFVAYQAYQAGMTKEQVDAELTGRGYDAEDLAEVQARVEVITQAQAAGMSMDDIKAKMEGREITADTASAKPEDLSPYLQGNWSADEGKQALTGSYYTDRPKKDRYAQLTGEGQMTAQQLVNSMRVVHPTLVSDTLTTIPAFFGNKEAQQRYDVARESSRSRIIDIAKESYGLDLVWQPNGVGDEGWYAQTDEGLAEVTPSFMQEIGTQAGEIAGGIGGAIAGAMTAGARAPGNPWLKLGAAAGGGLLGAVVGTNADYLYQSIKLHEDMEAEAIVYKSMNAAEVAAVGEALGYPVAKVLGVGWKGIVKAKEFVMGGEIQSAYTALKDSTFLSDDQINEIIAGLEKHTKLSGTQQQKGIQAVALTEPGMQDLVKAAGSTHPRASAVTAAQVQQRATDVLSSTMMLTDDQVPRMLSQDLQNYVIDVKDNYSRVKALATQSPGGKNFDFDFKELAISPVLDSLAKKITDPVTKEKFVLQMQRVNSMSESRSFGDLLELRQMTNDFLYNKRITKADDKETIRSVLSNIDEAIEDGIGSVVDRPAKWLDDWADVRKQYTQMKQTEKSAMYRAMFNKDGTVRAVQPETVVKALAKQVTSLDGNFEAVMSQMPMKGRAMYEGAVVNELANKYTTGIAQGAHAIHFPLLADELRKVNFTTPDARAAKQALIEMSEVFKNDPYLATTGGQVALPKFQSYLTTDPVVRAKFEAASGMFNYLKSKFPGDSNKQLALVRQTAKLLESPLNAKSFNELTKEVYPDVNLTKQLKELQQQAARDRAQDKDPEAPNVKVYSGGKLKGTGSSTSIPMHRILTAEQAKDIADAEALTLDSKSLDQILINYGYKAIMQGSDRVRILGEK